MVKRYKVEWTRTEGKVVEPRYVVLENKEDADQLVKYIATEPKTTLKDVKVLD